MIERGILFNAEMVRAILDGRKTNTMRPVKNFSKATSERLDFEDGVLKQSGQMFGCWHVNKTYSPPYGKVGDRLYVRETFWLVDSWATGDIPCVLYDREFKWYQDEQWQRKQCLGFWNRRRWRGKPKFGCVPSIHMPRWASRIDLEITGVKVMRVQDITEEEALADGGWIYSSCPFHKAPIKSFQRLWNSVYKNWDDNPWVWSYAFKESKNVR